ncbi:FecR family protein [Gaoshiqia sp. Z1-71]|uniref:FecR family protein n=1 Tax=Gaoshiqia hydrogeniformans TaxID=3290090 RepID=UPI003BF82CFD
MEEIFKKYSNSACTPEEYLVLVEYLRNSGNNTDIDRLMKEAWNNMKHQSGKTPDAGLLGRIHHQIALTENKRPGKTIRFYQISFRVASVVIIGLLITLAFFYQSVQSPDSEFALHFSTPAGAKANFELPDGSIVSLNSGSEMSYSANFKKNRNVQLKGEAYFEVKKNKGTFSVTTAYGNILVLGTGFNVKAYADDQFVTTLEHGSLEISTATGKEILKPGSQAFLDEKNQLQVKSVDVRDFVSWKDGKLIFVRQPLDEVLKMLERWYNVNIEMDLKEAKNLWFTGTIEMETISEVLEIIGQTLPIEYSFDKRRRTIKINAKQMMTKK